MKKRDYDKICSQCEFSEKLVDGEFYICKKKGVVEALDHCGAFCFDPMKLRVSVRKIPKFEPIPSVFGEDVKKEAK